MKFKATFTDRGLRTLEKGALLSLSKLYAKIDANIVGEMRMPGLQAYVQLWNAMARHATRF